MDYRTIAKLKGPLAPLNRIARKTEQRLSGSGQVGGFGADHLLTSSRFAARITKRKGKCETHMIELRGFRSMVFDFRAGDSDMVLTIANCISDYI